MALAIEESVQLAGKFRLCCLGCRLEGFWLHYSGFWGLDNEMEMWWHAANAYVPRPQGQTASMLLILPICSLISSVYCCFLILPKQCLIGGDYGVTKLVGSAPTIIEKRFICFSSTCSGSKWLLCCIYFKAYSKGIGPYILVAVHFPFLSCFMCTGARLFLIVFYGLYVIDSCVLCWQLCIRVPVWVL